MFLWTTSVISWTLTPNLCLTLCLSVYLSVCLSVYLSLWHTHTHTHTHTCTHTQTLVFSACQQHWRFPLCNHNQESVVSWTGCTEAEDVKWPRLGQILSIGWLKGVEWGNRQWQVAAREHDTTITQADSLIIKAKLRFSSDSFRW